MGIRISVEQVDNGFIFTSFDDQVGEAKTTVHPDAKGVSRAVRDVLGLKAPGRPAAGGDTQVVDLTEAE